MMELDGELDLVVFHADASEFAAWDLQYSVRSWVRHFPKLRNLYVIGKLPFWAAGVKHMDFRDTYENNKDSNLADKLLRCAFVPGLSDPFISTSDDHAVMREVTGSEVAERFAVEEIPKTVTANGWRRRVLNTGRWLRERGMTAWNFDTHTPHVVAKHWLPSMLDFPYGEKNGFTVYSMLLNPVATAYNWEVKLLKSERIRARIDKPHRYEDLGERIGENRYLNWDNGGRTNDLARFLAERFPEPCRFERDYWLRHGGSGDPIDVPPNEKVRLEV